MDVKHAAARKSFELAFSGVYKYINKNKEENLVKLMNLAHKIAEKTSHSISGIMQMRFLVIRSRNGHR